MSQTSMLNHQMLERLKIKGWPHSTLKGVCEVDGFQGVTSLMCALREELSSQHDYQDHDLVYALLEEDSVDLNAVDLDGCNALWYIADFPALGEVLLKRGIDANHHNKNGKNFLEECIDELPIIPVDEAFLLEEKPFNEILKTLQILVQYNATIAPQVWENFLKRRQGECWLDCLQEIFSKQEKRDLEKNLPSPSTPFTMKARI